jgi:IS30 family transposase
MWMRGDGVRAIAAVLGRSPSSVSRELRRNGNKGTYNHRRAAPLSVRRRKRCVRRERLEDAGVREAVAEGLRKGWSPEIIAARLRMGNPESRPPCAGTIYRALKAGLFAGEGITARSHLMRHGKGRNRHNSQSIHPERTIHERPEVIEERGRTGDLEGDTVLGGVGKGCLQTLVDRRTRMLYAALCMDKTGGAIAEGFRRALSGVTVESVTPDNGSEFSLFREIEKEQGVPVPKGADFRLVAGERLRQVVDLVNNRPRKCLGWLSPVEFASNCCT